MMQNLLRACLAKEPQEAHPYTPTADSLALSLKYRNGLVIEIVRTKDLTTVKAVEVVAAEGRSVAKLKAIARVEDGSELADLCEQVEAKYFGTADQDAVCDHWALLIQGNKNGLEVSKGKK